MARLLVISEEELRAVVERAVTEGVNAILRAATTLEADPAELTPATEPSASGVHAHKDGERFQIGSKPGEFSYADVIAQRYDDTEYEFERAWSSIKDQVITPSRRARACCCSPPGPSPRARRSLVTGPR